MTTSSSTTEGGAGRDNMTSALFASMIMQHRNMALIFLGQAPNPQTGQTAQDLEHARYFIDLLEMLAVKTKGNLTKQEEALLNQSLTHLRLSFVGAAEHPPKPAPADAAPATPSASAPATPPADAPQKADAEPAAPGQTAAESESHKKFSKRYE
jgi:hypothetical protein